MRHFSVSGDELVGKTARLISGQLFHIHGKLRLIQCCQPSEPVLLRAAGRPLFFHVENQRNRGKRLFFVKFFTEKLVQRRRRLRVSQRPVRLMGNIEMAAELPQIPARKVRKIFPGKLQSIDTVGFKGSPAFTAAFFRKEKSKSRLWPTSTSFPRKSRSCGRICPISGA